MPSPTNLLLLKQAEAKKTGQRAEGKIGYVVLADSLKSSLFIKLTSNDGGGGYFSNEAVPVGKVETCLASLKADTPFPAKVFASAFAGKSANNPGFLAAVLRAEGLLAPCPDAVHQHKRVGDFSAWKKAILALPGKPFVEPTKSLEAVPSFKKALPPKASTAPTTKAMPSPLPPKAS